MKCLILVSAIICIQAPLLNIPTLDNDDAYGRRLKIADDCLNDMIEWLQQGGGQVGIYDGNNITEDRRREIHDKLVAMDIHVNKKKKIFERYT